jgi:hypothetical protein
MYIPKLSHIVYTDNEGNIRTHKDRSNFTSLVISTLGGGEWSTSRCSQPLLVQEAGGRSQDRYGRTSKKRNPNLFLESNPSCLVLAGKPYKFYLSSAHNQVSLL